MLGYIGVVQKSIVFVRGAPKVALYLPRLVPTYLPTQRAAVLHGVAARAGSLSAAHESGTVGKRRARQNLQCVGVVQKSILLVRGAPRSTSAYLRV